MESETLSLSGTTNDDDELEALEDRPALVVAWCPAEPERVGQVLILPPDGDKRIFGRGESRRDDPVRHAQLERQRPGVRSVVEPLDDPYVSREQLALRLTDDGIAVENLGRRGMLVDQREVGSATLGIGQTLEIRGRMMFVCVPRPTRMTALRNPGRLPLPPFGAPDRFGFIGESPMAWGVRDRAAFCAGRNVHVLIVGESGTGKELVAQMIHGLSDRAEQKLVARNAATIPATLIDAELFGNAANYPNAGMMERPGLVGQAHQSTLFLDEIGELSTDLQAHLLRVLDDGEYQRLGDARRRIASFRLIAATNRPRHQLREDLAARLQLRMVLPGLNDRIEDVPLLARHLIRGMATEDPELGRRFCQGWDGRTGEPRITSALLAVLISHTYSTHVRELEGLLWRALSTSAKDRVELTDEVRAELDVRQATAPRPPRLTAEEIRASLDRNDWVQERVWRELGLANRYVLKRLIKKHGIVPHSPAQE